MPARTGSLAGPERVGPDRPVRPAVHGAEHGGGRQRHLCGGAGGGRRPTQAPRGGDSGTLPSPPRWVATYLLTYLLVSRSPVLLYVPVPPPPPGPPPLTQRYFTAAFPTIFLASFPATYIAFPRRSFCCWRFCCQGCGLPAGVPCLKLAFLFLLGSLLMPASGLAMKNPPKKTHPKNP